jgi:hypothetical protein
MTTSGRLSYPSHLDQLAIILTELDDYMVTRNPNSLATISQALHMLRLMADPNKDDCAKLTHNNGYLTEPYASRAAALAEQAGQARQADQAGKARQAEQAGQAAQADQAEQDDALALPADVLSGYTFAAAMSPTLGAIKEATRGDELAELAITHHLADELEARAHRLALRLAKKADGPSLAKIGAALGVTRQRAHQIAQAEINKPASSYHS